MARLNLNRSFHYAWLDLPLKKIYQGISFYYELGSTGGWFYDDKQCLVQLRRSNQICTLSIQNYIDWGNYDIETPNMNNFKKYFVHSLPTKIKERFPLLNKLLQNKTNVPSLSFYNFRDYGSSFSLRGEPISNESLTENQMKIILSCIDNVLAIENEYLLFKNSRLYNTISKSFRKQNDKSENITLAIGLFKLIKWGIQLSYGGFSNEGDNVVNESIILDDFNYDYTISQLDNNPSLVDYLISPDTDNSQNNINSDSVSDISFTGSNDKYSDNNYNRKEADYAFTEEQRLLEKGDIKGAEAAHKRGMNHLGRIKK